MTKNILYILAVIMGTNSVNAQNQDYLFMVEQAVKAPSGHNTQPWLFKINSNSIEVHPNFEKVLPVVDPYNRELFISLGCAVENLCLAASFKGYGTEVSIAGNGVITVGLNKNEQGRCDSLFEQIPVRQTNRSAYSGEGIADSTVDVLKKVVPDGELNVYFYKNGTPEFDTITAFVIKGNTTQMRDSAFTNELKHWMRFNKKHQNRTNDGLSYAVFGAPNLPMFIVKPIMSGYLNAKTQNKGDVKKMKSSSHFALFTTQANTVEQWIALGRVLERFLLKSTELSIAHAYLNQPNEVEELSVEYAESLNISNEYPTILLRIGYGKKQPYSKRKAIEEVIVRY